MDDEGEKMFVGALEDDALQQVEHDGAYESGMVVDESGEYYETYEWEDGEDADADGARHHELAVMSGGVVRHLAPGSHQAPDNERQEEEQEAVAEFDRLIELGWKEGDVVEYDDYPGQRFVLTRNGLVLEQDLLLVEDHPSHPDEEEEVQQVDAKPLSFKARLRGTALPIHRGSLKRGPTVEECLVCGVVLKHPSKIKAHMRTHTGERPFVCSYCGKRFTQRTPWNMHVKRHLNDLPFVCSYGCDIAFPNQSQQRAHDLRHQGKIRAGPPRPHLKPQKQLVTNNQRLDEFIVEDGMADGNVVLFEDIMGPPIVPAQIFDKRPQHHLSNAACRRIEDVINAVAENRPVEDIPEDTTTKKKRERRVPPIMAQCQICGIMMKHPSKIQAHMRTHTGAKPYRCRVCGMGLGTMYSLRIHKKRHHGGADARDHPCTWECGKAFTCVSARNEHEKIVHGGVRRYECVLGNCRRLFSRRYHLMQHRKREHPELFTLDEFGEDADAMQQIDYLNQHLHEIDEQSTSSAALAEEEELVQVEVEEEVVEEQVQDSSHHNGDEPAESNYASEGDKRMRQEAIKKPAAPVPERRPLIVPATGQVRKQHQQQQAIPMLQSPQRPRILARTGRNPPVAYSNQVDRRYLAEEH